MVEALVEYDYKAQEPDELTIKKGDLITNIEIKPGGWWEGTLSRVGKRGMFPDNFVKLIGDNNSNQEHKLEVTLRPTAGRQCKVLFSYKPLNEDELELKAGDIIDVIGEEEEGWWKGKLKNQVGVFPSNFVTEMDTNELKEAATRKPRLSQGDESSKPIDANPEVCSNQNQSSTHIISSSPPHEAPVLPPKPSKEMCRVLFPYEAVNEDELTLHEGDMITLITKEGQDVGWWKGELRGKIGVFPDNFVQLIQLDESTKPDRPANKPDRTTNKIRDSASKSVTNTVASATRRLSDVGKAPEEKASPPSVSKKPSLPPHPLKKSVRSPATNELSKSLTSPSLVSTKQQPDSPTSGVYPRVPLTNISSTKHVVSSSSEVVTSSTTTSSKWIHIEGDKGDKTDGAFMSKQSYTVTSGNSSSGITVSSNLTSSSANPEVDFDAIGRSAMLKHLSRAKAPPNRRLPSGLPSRGDLEEDNEDTGEGLVNGSAEVSEKSISKAPWVEELKLNQAKKTIQGKTRVTIGPPQTDPVMPAEQPAGKAASGVMLRSQPVTSQRPHSMFTSTKPAPPILDDKNGMISMRQWNELFEKVSKLEAHYESKIDVLEKNVKELNDKLDEERQWRIQIRLEIEKLTNLVTQV